MILCSVRDLPRPWWFIGIVTGLWALLVAVAPARCAPETLTVVLDQAKLVKLPEQASTLVIGNPLIADATLQSGGLMVLTGKGYGSTNLLALDRSGRVLMRRMIDVRAPKEAVFVYRGADRQTYSCTPTCERRVMLGDSDAAFAATLKQTADRNGQAQSAAR